MSGPSPRLLVSLVGALALLAVTPRCSSDSNDNPPDAGTADAGTADSGTPDVPVVPDRTSCSGLTLGPGDHAFTLTHQGRTRSYRVHIPPQYDATKPTPTVLNFHGFSSNELEQEALSQMSTVADAEGFIAVHPRGLSAQEIQGTPSDAGSPEYRSWNAGSCCGPAQINGMDDVGFVDAMLAEVSSRVCVDSRRIFSTGLSNGGFFSYRLACERSNLIAAIAPVAGMEILTPCTPRRPVPLMHFHGTADTIVLYDGGTIFLGGAYPSASESVARWAPRNGCAGPLVETYQRGDSTCLTHTGCAPENATATLCTVQDGGHTWPGGLIPADAGLGYTTQDLDATREMWRFFQTRPRP